jgi:hypothetical protein
VVSYPAVGALGSSPSVFSLRDELDPVGHGLPGAGEDTDSLLAIAQAAHDFAPDVPGTPDEDDHTTPSVGQSPKTNRTLPWRR